MFFFCLFVLLLDFAVKNTLTPNIKLEKYW